MIEWIASDRVPKNQVLGRSPIRLLSIPAFGGLRRPHVIWVKALGSSHLSLLQNKTPILVHLEVVPKWLCYYSFDCWQQVPSMIVSLCSKQLCLKWHGHFKYTQILKSESDQFMCITIFVNLGFFGILRQLQI